MPSAVKYRGLLKLLFNHLWMLLHKIPFISILKLFSGLQGWRTPEQQSVIRNVREDTRNYSTEINDFLNELWLTFSYARNMNPAARTDWSSFESTPRKRPLTPLSLRRRFHIFTAPRRRFWMTITSGFILHVFLHRLFVYLKPENLRCPAKWSFHSVYLLDFVKYTMLKIPY